MTISSSEFSVSGPRYDRRGPVRWLWSHLRRHPLHLLGFLGGSLAMVVFNAMVPQLTGDAFDAVLGARGEPMDALGLISLALLAIVLARGLFDIVARMSSEVLAKRLERDARDELYVSLLGKSQTFHNRQRVGDLMARAANDIRQLSIMMTPGIDLIVDSGLTGLVPLFFIAALDPRLLLVPGIFAVVFVVALRHYMRRLNPVATRMREEFGDLNAGLSQAVRGIEVIKVTAQEAQERLRFRANARRYRDSFVRNGLVQARYLPTLLYAVAMAGALWHALHLHATGGITIGEVVAFMGLMGMLGFPTQMSIFTFSLVQIGIVSSRRILSIITSESEIEQRADGHAAPISGEIVFEDVTFAYDEGGEPALRGVTFTVRPGETVAIVGETGSGKSTLTKLVPRIYDVTSGRILVDGVDVRDWDLDSLRSQISTIEQDIVLFSRSVAENIAFSTGQRADREAVVRAARDAQADEFIGELEDGYDTVIGERGVTLSGGQRQRLAIARAFLTDPAILVLDDSTSAIDSATEDKIQQAIGRILEGRTTLLITHRLSQIRWADKVLLLRRGQVVDFGTHDELIRRSRLYRRVFAHYDEADVHADVHTEGPVMASEQQG
ncbi:ATP-binding cassette subfamily B protein [Thermocatellispora tengchongensis]|uniref:ATP-binding cassette subfamily B protein n=1 Tax=Thermocatellispora tengchongensis TaxID=1073253 RepID=A0A840PDV2_9ACTN|nr:ABC transporter ATP-binding protein [Thermocatellispora tengchongensis]MBB5134225.1 ATP-binding cassette subfamily B protein [Thermocatellispora tengchongensis]